MLETSRIESSSSLEPRTTDRRTSMRIPARASDPAGRDPGTHARTSRALNGRLLHCRSAEPRASCSHLPGLATITRPLLLSTANLASTFAAIALRNFTTMLRSAPRNASHPRAPSNHERREPYLPRDRRQPSSDENATRGQVPAPFCPPDSRRRRWSKRLRGDTKATRSLRLTPSRESPPRPPRPKSEGGDTSLWAARRRPRAPEEHRGLYMDHRTEGLAAPTSSVALFPIFPSFFRTFPSLWRSSHE